MARKMKTMDGNSAAAHVSYAFTDVAAIYPITPSSVMADETDKYATVGRKNLFGREVQVTEMQSEGGAAGAVHGSLTAGALTTTYTASQGLLLMIPNMYKIAGELLPSVIHVSARALTSHALSIFGDHSDIYACRQTGYAMLCSNNPQEVMDLAAVAHLAAIKGRVPFLHFFDGFRTSHEIQKIEYWDYEDLGDMLDWDAVEAFRKRSLNPEHPHIRGTAQNDDIFFQAREACNKYYDAIPEVVVEYMNKVNTKLGTDYKPFNYYGAEDAEHVIVAMGSVCDATEEVVDYLNAAGEKVGLLKVHLYRPFVADYMLSELPKTVKTLSVLDRTKEPGSIGEPLYLDVLAAINASEFANVSVYTGRYGLGSKDTTPGDIVAVYRNAESATPKKRFTIGIVDDVTNLSLPIVENPDTTPAGTTSCKFWGLGADGTVGANKNSIKIIGDHTDMYAQGYFAYDSKKSGGLTVSHLRFGHKPIKSTYYISKADFVACHNPSYVDKYEIVEDLKEGGSFLLNCPWSGEELDHRLPAKMKKQLADKHINFYTIDGIKLGKEIGLGTRINTILQSAFFKIADIIPAEDAKQYLKDAATKSYSKKGQAIVDMNHKAIDMGMENFVKVEVPAEWSNCVDDSVEHTVTEGREEVVKYVNGILNPVNAYKGNKLPVSSFMDYVDGEAPQGSAAYEKRGIAVDVPEWNPTACVQCNICSMVCPHAVIRPIAMTEEELANAPKQTKSADMKPANGMKFVMAISTLDCTGCGACVQSCLGNKKPDNKALVMKSIDSQRPMQEVFDYAIKTSDKPEIATDKTVKSAQFKQPLLEFSGACAGCGETAYIKLVTQLFGDRMMIANATGCSSIWGGSAPSTPYTKNHEGKGPAWANSLFEDNAEFGYGMKLAQNYNEAHMIQVMEEAKDACEPELKEIIEKYLSVKGQRSEEKAIVPELLKLVEASSNEAIKEVLDNKGNLVSKSQWIVGGDGWAYDIGYGGLDHVIANNENVNILVLDTEVYSNTGGQSSKSSQAGSIAKFTAGGKTGAKKDLAQIAMAYGHVYVAQVAMGANPAQTIKALKEAESYDGPSLIIAYAPCQAHGIKGGLANHQAEQKRAIDCGYFNLLRYDPRLEEEGKNPLQLDSKTPNFEGFKDYLLGENRFSQLLKVNPEHAEQLMAKCQADAQKRRARLEKMAQ